MMKIKMIILIMLNNSNKQAKQEQVNLSGRRRKQ